MLPITSSITRTVKTCTQNKTVLEAARIMAENDIGSIVVVEGKKPIGMFTERDLLKRVVAAKIDPEKTLISEVMTKKLMLAEECDSCSSSYMKMKKKGFRHLPVVENGELIGIVTLTDIVKLMNDLIIKQMYLPDSSGLY